LGLPTFVAGGVLLGTSLVLAGSRGARTRYRPDPWRTPEWITVLAGAAALGGLLLAASLGVADLHPDYSPLRFPTLPLLPAIAIGFGALPALATPELPADMVPTAAPRLRAKVAA
jgi:energy-coupling factor transport system permease protein